MPEAEAGNGGGVGELLRSTREARGVTLEEATRTTKISRTYLTAIEEGRFEKLPNPAYIKGFLRLYAGFLGLSGDEVVARYEATLPPAEAHPEEADHPHLQVVERVRFGGHGRWAVPALLLCLVILAAIFLTEGQERMERPAPPQQPAPPPPPAPAAAPPPQPVLQPVSSAQQAPPGPLPATAGGDSGQGAAPPVKGVMLRLRFNRDSWLTITIDDSITQRYDLKAGDIVEWKGERQFSLDLGDGGAVEAEFNGRPLKPLGEPGRQVHVELKGEGQQ
ncbi:DUF4115 domain-containing protein [Geomonas sp. RF6]|uniref:helix-turn-helix domain-containing protein n=1 Tax=Geomonas sp. RF6 TaxID=2897342 RepID=UPI001E5345DC|nr:helix-turn-helix domain-containing protein [Geomonas sp. RF6]UFS71268.1 DUF4115 domain-containing protein [Geomonas sp. RF6]